MTGETDARLVAGTRAGSAEAYGELVTRYQGHVYALAQSLAGNWADAQDIAQETFIRAYVNLHQLHQPERFAAWLRRVTFGVGMNWLKAYRSGLFAQLDGRVDLDSLEIPDFQPAPAEVVEKRELAAAVLGAIHSLPAKYRVPLTMFHLDGLSYQKVADFLDIPLGTAKSLIHRAREKLKDALAPYVMEEVTPMVQEVFDEHRLPEQFVRKVLQGLSSLSWEKGETTFAGAVVACLQFLHQEVSYEHVMGVSGGAFRLLWYPKWCPSNNDLLVLGEEPVRRVFRALGREYRHLERQTGEEHAPLFREAVKESIAQGRPVIAMGVMGPESSVIAGYEEEGSAWLGRSYFVDTADRYHRVADWPRHCSGVITIGDDAPRPAPRELLRESLTWALDLAHTPEREGRASGLAAYDVWADALGQDEHFPEGDLETLTFRCNVHRSVTLSGLWDSRRAAAAFLRQMATTDASERLLQAAAVYEQEVTILESAMRSSPHCTTPEEERLRMSDSALRRSLAELILQAKQIDQEAVGHLEQALQQLK